jgi:asparagine synthase (glutamine-hydrolysing)
MLSGLGGDEVTGGVPTPIPELTDLLAALRVLPLAHQLKQWALRQRRPWFHLLAETCRAFLPVALVDVPAYAKPALWIRPGFARRHRTALRGYPNRLRLFGPLPSFQQRVSTLEALRRRLAWSALSPDFPCEIRYPYLDRHLLEFLFAVPPDQLVRPGQRRSLMRRALNGIVPPEILNRKRKAFVSRAPRFAIKDCWGQLTSRDFLCSSLEIVDSATLLDALKRAKDGEDLPLPPLVRTLSLECWLRRLANRKVLAEPLKPDHPQLLFSAGSTP